MIFGFVICLGLKEMLGGRSLEALWLLLFGSGCLSAVCCGAGLLGGDSGGGSSSLEAEQSFEDVAATVTGRGTGILWLGGFAAFEVFGTEAWLVHKRRFF